MIVATPELLVNGNYDAGTLSQAEQQGPEPQTNKDSCEQCVQLENKVSRLDAILWYRETSPSKRRTR
jgi:hypothetical protein